MKRALISTAAAALLLASQGSAFAQPRDRGDGPGGNPGAGPQAPGPGPGSSPGGNPGAGPGPGRDSGPPASRPQAPSPAQRGPANTPKAERPERPAQQRAEPKGPNVEKQQRTSEPKAPAKQQPTPQADGKGKDADPKRTTRDATPKADSKSESKAETKAGPGKEADRVGQDKSQDKGKGKEPGVAQGQDKGQDKGKGKGPGVAQGQDKGQEKGHNDRMAGQQDMRQARDRLDRTERVRLHDAFDRRRARANINIDIRVGRNVPRSVRLVPVPRTVISFFPYYRDYSYFAVGDTICIVDPRSYEVVDVIDEGYRNAQPTQQARLSLDAAQMALVRDSIPSDMRVERISLRLALGAEIPRDVELNRFDPSVIDRVRDLERYRFVLVEDEIVVVDPSDRSIALVIDRT